MSTSRSTSVVYRTVRGTNCLGRVGRLPGRAPEPHYPRLASRHSLRRNRSVTNRPYGAQMTDVVLVRWPEETERLERLRAAGSPRLLLVGEDLAAPEPVDPLEDWIRLPAAEDDLRVRVSTLASRGRARGGRTERRRRRPAPLPGSLGHALAGGAGARGGAHRPLQRGGRTRHAGPASMARWEPHPQRARRAHAAPPAADLDARTRGPHGSGPWVPVAGARAQRRELTVFLPSLASAHSVPAVEARRSRILDRFCVVDVSEMSDR